MRHNKLRFLLGILAATVLCASGTLRAQEPGQELVGRGGGAGMPRVVGEVTAVDGPKIMVKGQDGAISTVITSDNTRIMKGRGNMIKVTDIKVGDGIMAVGNLDAANKTLHAALVATQDSAEMKKLRDAMGKTLIAGKVTSIDVDNAKMTLTRPDGASQTIGFDETTSFKRGRAGRGGMGMGMGGDAAEASTPTPPTAESLTLADIKVGDNVGGPGSVKNGVFVPTTLSVSTPGQGQGQGQGRRRGAGTTSPATPDPASK